MIIGVPKEIKTNENRVALVPAGAENLKVTTPLDLEVAELVLARRARRADGSAAGAANPA